MIIREEKESDIPPIAHIHNQAFNSADEARIVEKLRKNNKITVSLVCESDGEILGHIAYSPVYSKNEIAGVGLAPVAVLPSVQKQGIGTKLINSGNHIVFSKGFEKIFVLGDPAYYSRFGFENAKKYNYFSQFDPEGHNFMILGKDIRKQIERIDIDFCEEFYV